MHTIHIVYMQVASFCSGKLAFTAINQKTEVANSDEKTDDAFVEAPKRRIINSGQST